MSRIKLKENAREWQKLVLVLGLVSSVAAFLLARRGAISREVFAGVVALAGMVWVLSLVRPRWFRPLYRGWMTGAFYVGQVMGKVLLAVLFVLMVVPMGIVLRVMGKDLIGLKKESGAKSYWSEAKQWGPFERMY